MCCLKDNIDREDIVVHRFCLYVNIYMYFEVRNIKRLALQVKETTSSSRASAAGLHNVILSIYLFKGQVYEFTDLLW